MNNIRLVKVARVFAGLLFLVVLVVNIKVTLDDPFLMLTENAVIQSSNFSYRNCSTVPISEGVRGKRGEIVDVIGMVKVRKCLSIFVEGLNICWKDGKVVEGVVDRYCDCVDASLQDYCLVDFGGL